MIKLELNKGIYSKKAISLACEAYQGFAKIQLVEWNDKYIVVFRKCVYDAWTTAREFENFLIGVENS